MEAEHALLKKVQLPVISGILQSPALGVLKIQQLFLDYPYPAYGVKCAHRVIVCMRFRRTHPLAWRRGRRSLGTMIEGVSFGAWQPRLSLCRLRPWTPAKHKRHCQCCALPFALGPVQGPDSWCRYFTLAKKAQHKHAWLYQVAALSTSEC